MPQPNYDFWKDALAGKKPPMSEGSPEPGFYRMRSKNKQTGAISWQPVAYWYSVEDSRLHCMIGDNETTEQRGQEVWTYVGQHAVTEEQYRAVADDGKNWHDQDQIVADQTRGMGDNSGALDEFEAFKDQIGSASEGADGYKKITNKEESERGQSLRARLLELAGQAEKARKKIADPLHKEWKAVNDRWKPIITLAEDGAAAIKRSNDNYLTEQLRLQRAAEEIAAALVETAKAEAEMMEPEAIVPTPVPQMPAQVRGGYGRAASVKTEWALIGITDLDLVYAHFKASAAVKECLEELARKAIKAGGEVPGTTREERAVTR